MTVSGIPNIRVIIREADDENLLVEVPNISVRVIQDDSYNVNITPPVTVAIRSGSYNRFADVALLAYTASYLSGSGVVAGFATSASYAASSSIAESAITASYALNAGAGAGFPYSGSAVITGSLLISSSGLTVIGDGITGSLFGTASYASVA